MKVFVLKLILIFFLSKRIVTQDNLNERIETIGNYWKRELSVPTVRSGGNTFFRGRPIAANQWPWLVALLEKQFFCGGSLISKKHVLSAAHCFQEKQQTSIKPSQYITAIVGKQNLEKLHKIGSKSHKVWDVIIHPDWDPTTYSFDADVALVVLWEPVKLIEHFIGTVSLSRSSEELTGLGIVVGWGKSERSEAIGNDFDYRSNKIEFPVVSQTECFEASKDLQATASNRTFCAGYMNQEKAICAGDSGSGFYQYKRSRRRYELAGIVSASVNDPFRLCEIDMYSLFTNVAKFTSWIDQQMEETKEIKWKDVDFYCNLHPRSNRHTCIHNFIGPMTRNLKIRHQLASNVQKLSLKFGESLHIFAGIGETFPKLIELFIINQKIKYTDANNFDELDNLEKLYLRGNQIEFLSEDVFMGLYSLKDLDLSDNKIMEIPENFFSFSWELEVVKLQNNKIYHLPADLFENTRELKEFHAWGNPLKKIDINFDDFPNLKFYKNSSSDYFKGNINFVSRIHFGQ